MNRGGSESGGGGIGPNSDAETSLDDSGITAPGTGPDSSFQDVKPGRVGANQNYGDGGVTTITASPTTTTATPDYKREPGVSYHQPPPPPNNRRCQEMKPDRTGTPPDYGVSSKSHRGGDGLVGSSEVSSSSTRAPEDERDAEVKLWKAPEVTRRAADTSTRGATPHDDESLAPSGNRHQSSQHRSRHQQQHHLQRGNRKTTDR